MQAGGVAPAAAAPAPAPAAGDVGAEYVFIKREGGAAADDEVYAELAMLPGDTVARLAERACAKFQWGSPSQARLRLVERPPDAEEPPSTDEEALAVELQRPHWKLARAGVGAGAWLLARLPAAAAAAAAAAGASSCGGGAHTLSFPRHHPPLCRRS